MRPVQEGRHRGGPRHAAAAAGADAALVRSVRRWQQTHPLPGWPVEIAQGRAFDLAQVAPAALGTGAVHG